jgi:hypothetical protein
MTARSSSYKREGLRTIVEMSPMTPRITYDDRIMLMGSCFTEHIGNRLKSKKFAVYLNPFGIVYNPLSMAGQIQYLLKPTGFSSKALVFHDDLWHSWMHHSRFSHPDDKILLQTIRDQALASAGFLEKTKFLILTFGTAEAYFLKSNDLLVANCHKLPAGNFYSRIPDPAELAGHWIPLLGQLWQRNPGLRICLTVSPVRYFKDGPVSNQLSKSVLFLFIEKLIRTYPEIYYFPSYEIFMDDLRDYRFYDTDMMHPGPSGIDYVWDRFAGACIDPGVYPLMDEIESVVRAAGHRPSGHRTDAHARFVLQQTERIRSLQRFYPFLDFSEELEMLGSQAASDQP